MLSLFSVIVVMLESRAIMPHAGPVHVGESEMAAGHSLEPEMLLLISDMLDF